MEWWETLCHIIYGIMRDTMPYNIWNDERHYAIKEWWETLCLIIYGMMRDTMPCNIWNNERHYAI